MSISQWLKEYVGTTLAALKKKNITNEEWEEICREYEKYCKTRNLKPDYDR
ncbi:hypothetical protein [Bacillus sp. JJ722]|uniref:hypothetical protein n=1 Tax=Bacillus sp. JJ722 TaxID=3122973 RepID=UPI002FFE8D71